MARKAYKTTRVPVSRTQEVIRRLLQAHGVKGVQFTDDFVKGQIMLRFVKEVEGQDRTVAIKLVAGDNERQAYRALYYWMKSQLEAVDFGLVEFEDVFLAHFEWLLDSGVVTTVGEMVKRELAGRDQPSLLAPPEEEWEVIEGEDERTE